MYCSITIHLDVTEPELLWDAANAHPDACELGEREDPNIGNCLVVLLDPGVSPPGTKILESTTEEDDD